MRYTYEINSNGNPVISLQPNPIECNHLITFTLCVWFVVRIFVMVKKNHILWIFRKGIVAIVCSCDIKWGLDRLRLFIRCKLSDHNLCSGLIMNVVLNLFDKQKIFILYRQSDNIDFSVQRTVNFNSSN